MRRRLLVRCFSVNMHVAANLSPTVVGEPWLNTEKLVSTSDFTVRPSFHEQSPLPMSQQNLTHFQQIMDTKLQDLTPPEEVGMSKSIWH